MSRALAAWPLVVALATTGVLASHELAYLVTGTPRGDTHGYLAHAPTVALMLAVLALVGASLVERGRRVALWPFPAVVVAGFVGQEHLERLAHDGSLPFLLDEPYFLVGLALDLVVAFLAWLVARALVRVAGCGSLGRRRLTGYVDLAVVLVSRAPAAAAVGNGLGARSPPAGC